MPVTPDTEGAAVNLHGERWIEPVGVAEWGVRWKHPVRGGVGEVWRSDEGLRDDIVKERRFQGYDVETAQRTVTTTSWKSPS